MPILRDFNIFYGLFHVRTKTQMIGIFMPHIPPDAIKKHSTIQSYCDGDLKNFAGQCFLVASGGISTCRTFLRFRFRSDFDSSSDD